MELADLCKEMYGSLVGNRLQVLKILEEAYGFALPHTPQIIVASGKNEFNPIVGPDSTSESGIDQGLALFSHEYDLISLHPDMVPKLFSYAHNQDFWENRVMTDVKDWRNLALSLYAKELLTDIYFHRHKIIDNPGEENDGNYTRLYNQHGRRVPNGLNMRNTLLYWVLPRIRIEAVGYLAYQHLDGNEKTRLTARMMAIGFYNEFERELSDAMQKLDSPVDLIYSLGPKGGLLLGVDLIERGRNMEAAQELFNRNPFDVNLDDIGNFERTLADYKGFLQALANTQKSN